MKRAAPALERLQRERRGPVQGLSALAVSLLLTACQVGERTVTVPISNWPGYEYFGLAADLGLDRRHGLKLKVVEYADPQEIVHAYLRGEQWMAPLTTVEAVDLCERIPSRCPVVVLVLDESRGGDQLAARKDMPSIEALRGQTIAVTYSTLGPYVVNRALEQKGLTITDVTLRNMPLDRMPDALSRGEVAAAAFFPPYSERAERSGKSHVLFTSRQIPGEIFDVLVVDPQYLREHAAEVNDVIRSWSDAHQASRQNPTRSLRLMAQREQVTVAEYAKSEQGLVYFPLQQQQDMLRPGGVIAQNLARVQAVQQRIGISRPGAPLPSTTNFYVKTASGQKPGS